MIFYCFLGPSAPIITNLTCQSIDSIYVQWDRPKIVYHRIDMYFLSYRSENTWEYEEISITSSQERQTHSVCNLLIIYRMSSVKKKYRSNIENICMKLQNTQIWGFGFFRHFYANIFNLTHVFLQYFHFNTNITNQYSRFNQ